MATIDLARRLAQLGETKDALRAYALVLNEDVDPAEHLEAAAYTLQNGGDYKMAYTAFVSLYNEGCFREDILPVMMQAFYAPNVKLIKSRYERNCKALAKYPYLFRKDFLPFDELPLVFAPYDDNNGYVPYSPAEDRFLNFVNVKDPVVSRNFFADLEKPVLASNVYSQYELEYLNDNVRKSEWVGRENHIYLHYTDWSMFCAWLQVLTMKPLVEEKKFVFLIGDEIVRYPIDFKKEFGIDYTQYEPHPLGFREVNKLIWHTQLMAHNGGDFFNEIFDSHPNLLWGDSTLLSDYEDGIAGLREKYGFADLSDKDVIVAHYLRENQDNPALHGDARIVPALFLQPHFMDMESDLHDGGDGRVVPVSSILDRIHASKIFEGFKYIKTFTPIRRPTTSHGAVVRYMVWQHEGRIEQIKEDDIGVIPDVLCERLMNRSYLRDPSDRLYHDAAMVRFEDGKLNPKATFSALAAFLDLPYTESMTYGSIKGNRDPHHMGESYVKGFGTWALTTNYDEFTNDTERYFLEYFLRDVYKTYGYDFRYYDGAPIDEMKADELIRGFTKLDGYMRNTWRVMFHKKIASELSERAGDEAISHATEQALESFMAEVDQKRRAITRLLLGDPTFCNRDGQPLQMIPLIELDPTLMERELYH